MSPSLNCKKLSILYTNSKGFYTAGSVLCWKQKLETGVDCKMDSNCCAQGSHNTRIPKATLQRAARLSPQAVTGPAHEKVSSGDGYGSHTHCNKDFQSSCLTAYCYSLRDDWKRRVTDKRTKNCAAPITETWEWVCIASLRGANQGCSPPLPFQQNKWTSRTACDICITGDRSSELSERMKSK